MGDGKAPRRWCEVEALRARLALADRNGGLTSEEHAALQAEYDRRRAVLAAHRVRVVRREADDGWLLRLGGPPGGPGGPGARPAPGPDGYAQLPDGRRLCFAYESQALDYAWYGVLPRVAPAAARAEGLVR